MGNYTDTYVETLQQDLQRQYRKAFEAGEELVKERGKRSDRDIEIEHLTFALKNKDNELESVRDEHRTLIDELMEKIERLKRNNKKPFKVAELRRLIDRHTNVLEEHRTAILEVREVIDQNKETLNAAQREMLTTLDRHDGLISRMIQTSV